MVDEPRFVSVDRSIHHDFVAVVIVDCEQIRVMSLAEHVFVRVLQRVRMFGRDEIIAGTAALTDDRGEYRISGLTPGRYLVQVPSVQAAVPSATKFPAPSALSLASPLPDGVMDIDDTARLVIGRYPLPPPPAAGRALAYPVMFHPSATSVTDAGTIELKFGEERPSVVVSSGAALALPFFVVARLHGARTVFVESHRLGGPSRAGRVCYLLSDLFVVQWEEQRRYYKKGELVGCLL